MEGNVFNTAPLLVIPLNCNFVYNPIPKTFWLWIEITVQWLTPSVRLSGIESFGKIVFALEKDNRSDSISRGIDHSHKQPKPIR